jgi:hypothetical protein
LARSQQLPEAIAVLERVLNSRSKAMALLQRWLTRRTAQGANHEQPDRAKLTPELPGATVFAEPAAPLP